MRVMGISNKNSINTSIISYNVNLYIIPKLNINTWLSIFCISGITQ
jgi:hypothetical protein